MIKNIFFIILVLFFLGCSQKSQIKKGLTANELHSLLYKDVKNNMLDDADNVLMELEANYPNSFYIKDDLLMLFYAHLKNEDFNLAKFYLDQYEKRFASIKEIPWCEYQKIKIDFLAYQNAYTNQGKILSLLKKCELYKLKYPNSTFIYEVNTIYMKTLLTNKYLNDKIYKLYMKENKKEAAKKYKTNIPKNSIAPNIPWYKKIFYW
ncbi:outer membrane protein assembly factor BamD [Caminibacter mediatlanticus TB-2]|uniref:Outer membrane protein assembly factor BamD n=1 Tax=Caminibacter mediatlanticus TB-2 TaxID=391592 RepID=A0AAI9AIK6_9BACT|nr:outer membrane protein assembly factor BamD [Caminibacter mediatlanticus]EDM24250.1 hypothetical protein CMTB2_02003 [Caminibacter mediatlanticus TB-2]QCT94896.1 outer membrane protein assembly factor BamD [Caminibacter mediatlanticus TB-2]